MAFSELTVLRHALAEVQKHPHHAFVNTKGAPPLEAVCRGCPARRLCRAASVALATAESVLLSLPSEGTES